MIRTHEFYELHEMLKLEIHVPKCPKCEKAMAEQSNFPGLWLCPDYIKPINSEAPFRYKCNGMHLTEKAADELREAIEAKISESN